jgi:hypothetical protein
LKLRDKGDVLGGGVQTPLVLEVNTVTATMRDVIEKVLKQKLGVDSPVIMQGSSLLYETGDDLEDDMAAHYASLLNKVHKHPCCIKDPLGLAAVS